jgi:hypothetical protein
VFYERQEVSEVAERLVSAKKDCSIDEMSESDLIRGKQTSDVQVHFLMPLPSSASFSFDE